MSIKYKIAVLSGDGIGPEIIQPALDILRYISQKKNISFDFQEALVGGVAIDELGEPLPKLTLELCESSDAILFGSVGGPKWEKEPPEKQPERGALLPLRKHFELFANLRPSILYPELSYTSPLKKEILGDQILDILVIRELTGGIYFGKPKGRIKHATGFEAFDTMRYTTSEIERIACLAFEAAALRNKVVHSIDKANVLSTSVLWREVVHEVHKNYQDIELIDQYVDNTAMQLIKNPHQFDVILCSNLFGDILSDEISQLVGSIGNLPSASLGDKKSKWVKNGVRFGLYEPAGGSAPDIAGKNIANPIAQILSAALMLRYSFKLKKEAIAVEQAVQKTIANNILTGDLLFGSTNDIEPVGTKEMGESILKNLESTLI